MLQYRRKFGATVDFSLRSVSYHRARSQQDVRLVASEYFATDIKAFLMVLSTYTYFLPLDRARAQISSTRVPPSLGFRDSNNNQRASHHNQRQYPYVHHANCSPNSQLATLFPHVSLSKPPVKDNISNPTSLREPNVFSSPTMATLHTSAPLSLRNDIAWDSTWTIS